MEVFCRGGDTQPCHQLPGMRTPLLCSLCAVAPVVLATNDIFAAAQLASQRSRAFLSNRVELSDTRCSSVSNNNNGGNRRRLVHGSFEVESVPFPGPVPPASLDPVNHGAIVIWSPIFWGHQPSGYGYWDRLFGMFATAFLDAGFTDVHNMTGCIPGQRPCSTPERCQEMRICINTTLSWVRELYLNRTARDASYGVVLVTMVYTPLLVLPADTSLDEYADPGWQMTKALLIELGSLGVRIVFNEYLLEGIPNAHVLTPDNYNSGVAMVEQVCSGLAPGSQIMIIGPMLIEEQIEPSTFGRWRDLLRWERMRGYVDGIERFCGLEFIDSMLWVPESSTATSRLSTEDMMLIFRANPRISVVLTAFPLTVSRVLDAAAISRPGGVNGLRVTTYDENDMVRALWREGRIAKYQNTQRTQFDFGLVPALVNFVPALLQWRIQVDNASYTSVGGAPKYYLQDLPQVLVTPVFLRSDRMQADLLRELFAQYEQEQRPVTDGFTPVNVSIEVHLLDIDSLNRDFTLRGSLRAVWYDPRLTWDTRWEIPELVIPVTGEWPDLRMQIWRPLLRPRRAKNYEVDETIISVTSDGVVTMVQDFQARSFCSYDYTDFPSDTQNCAFNMTTSSQYVALYPGEQLTPPDFESPDDFIALRWSLTTDEAYTSGIYELPMYVSLRFSLVRDVMAFVYPIIIPCFLISVISVLMFAMESTPDRVNMGVIALLVFFVMRDMTDSMLPPSAGFNWMVEWFLFNMLFITVMITCFVTNWDSLLLRKFIFGADKAARSRVATRVTAKRSRLMSGVVQAGRRGSPTLQKAVAQTRGRMDHATAASGVSSTDEAMVSNTSTLKPQLHQHGIDELADAAYEEAGATSLGGESNGEEIWCDAVDVARDPPSVTMRGDSATAPLGRKKSKKVFLNLGEEEEKSFYQVLWADKPLETRIDYISLISFLTAYLVIASRMLLRLDWQSQ